MKQDQPATTQIYGAAGPVEALRQVAALAEQATKLSIRCAFDGTSFQSEGPGPHLASIQGRLVDHSVIVVTFQMLQAEEAVKARLSDLWAAFSSINEKVQLLPPAPDAATGKLAYRVTVRVKAEPMSHARSTAFAGELEKLDGLARALQAGLPVPLTDAALRERYKDVAEFLEPVASWQADQRAMPASLRAWGVETLDFLLGASSVALAAAFPVQEHFMLALLAQIGQEHGRTLGLLRLPAIHARGLLDLVEKAPGTVVVPVNRLSLGTNRYEAESEIPALLEMLSGSGRPVLFTGTRDALQALFHGGQGGVSDPLQPVVRTVPDDLALDDLVRFAVRFSAHRAGGLPEAVLDELTSEALDVLRDRPPAEQHRVLPALASRLVRVRDGGLHAALPPAASFASKVGALSETFAGISARPRVVRAPAVQQRFVERLIDDGLPAYFRSHLVAQDRALDRLVAHLRKESLTRPRHQPIRYAAQGTPGTGKSESAVLLARFLEVPYVNIDAASMPDHHTAAAQLLGSGRGIVESHRSGRLEQAAKHHQGAVVEVSDLDHAAPPVRAGLADLFLQVLERGEAQSAKGALFSCANLILAFTMNLPDGRDEAVRLGFGFQTPSERDVERRVSGEIRAMLSGAFLSRIGTPILFAPLDGEALALILERAVAEAVRSAAENVRLDPADVVLQEGLGARMMAAMEAPVRSSGARTLLDHGRALAAGAFLAFLDHHPPVAAQTLFVRADDRGTLTITC